VSISDGSGGYSGISPCNKRNSEVLLKLVKKINPDIIYVLHECGLYGLFLNSIRPFKTSTVLDKFYDKCGTPIVTTFHTSIYFKHWMRLRNIKEKGKDNDYKILLALQILATFY
jgi:hypothetical protein